MNNPKEKKFHMLCSYKEAGKSVSDDELRDAFDDAVCEAGSFLEPVIEDDGNIDHLAYAEERGLFEEQVYEQMIRQASPEIQHILLCT